MPSTFTEHSVSGSEVRDKKSAHLEAEAVGLEVPVRIYGSQVTAVVLDTTEHVEPFEEDALTMIVFPRGALVKLQARVRAGHAAVVTNLKTKRTVNCRIVQVNPANGSHYVKLEFTEAVHDFWGLPFVSEQQLSANSAVQEQHNGRNFETDSNPVFDEGVLDHPAVPPRIETANPPVPVAAPRPPVSMPVRDEKPAPAANSTSYDFSERTSDDIVPLAAAPAKSGANAAEDIAPRLPAIDRSASSSIKASRDTAEAAIFDSLSTDEDVFGPEKPGFQTARKSEKRESKPAKPEFQTQLRSLTDALEPAPKTQRKSSRKGLVAVFVAIILIAAGGGWYLLRHRPQSASVGSIAPIGDLQSPAPDRSAETNTAPSSPPAAIQAQASQSSHGGQNSAVPAQDQTTSSGITITPIENSSASSTPASTSSSDASVQTGSGAPAAALPNIYAGDTARPILRKAPKVSISVAPPQISTAAPNGISVPANAALSGLVGATAGLPAPPKPEPAMVKGGRIVAPRLIHSVPLAYPTIAINSHVEGDVQVQAVIDAAGKVISAKAISGPGLLRNAAVNAVRQWRYSPATLDGKPIQMPYVVTVRFRLNQ